MNEQLYKWVKASEESPIVRDIYHVKVYNETHGIDDGIFEDTRIFDPRDKWSKNSFQMDGNYIVLEWLKPITPDEQDEAFKTMINYFLGEYVNNPHNSKESIINELKQHYTIIKNKL